MLTPDVAQQIGTNGLTHSSQFEVKTGGYAVRFVVRDNVTGRLRSVDSAWRVGSRERYRQVWTRRSSRSSRDSRDAVVVTQTISCKASVVVHRRGC
jgi:hypothetical protein